MAKLLFTSCHGNGDKKKQRDKKRLFEVPFLLRLHVWINGKISSIVEPFSRKHQPCLQRPAVSPGYSIPHKCFSVTYCRLKVHASGINQISKRIAGFPVPDAAWGWFYPFHFALDGKTWYFCVVSQIEDVSDVYVPTYLPSTFPHPRQTPSILDSSHGERYIPYRFGHQSLRMRLGS